jgi:hypothetical protein
MAQLLRVTPTDSRRLNTISLILIEAMVLSRTKGMWKITSSRKLKKTWSKTKPAGKKPLVQYRRMNELLEFSLLLYSLEPW